MRVSKSEEYAVRLATSLAASGGQLTIRELAAREGLAEPTVAKVIARLRRAGLVEAARGRKGGYSLALPAERLSLASVVEAMSGRLQERSFCSRMTPGGSSCVHLSRCGLRPVWRDLETVIGAFLAGVSVADVAHGAGIAPRPLAASGGSS